MIELANQYYREHGDEPVELAEIAAWAVRKGLWSPKPQDVVKRCATELGDALRQEVRVDAEGRKYRAKHCVRTKNGAEQLFLWADIDKAPRKFMEKSFAERRKSIVGDCTQLSDDVGHYNQYHTPNNPIQLVLDFTDDVEEIKLERQQKEKSA